MSRCLSGGWIAAGVVWLSGAAGCTSAAEGIGEPCRLASDCPAGRYCRAGGCVFDCRDDRDCVADGRGARCDLALGRCADAAAGDAGAPGGCVGGCDENTPRPSGCDGCGGGGGWGAGAFSFRGVCAYGNGSSVNRAACPAGGTTGDGQTPVGCAEGFAVTWLGAERRQSYAFQCVEFARRVTHARSPTWASIGGNACAWWSAAGAAGVTRHENGGEVAPRPDDLMVFYSPGDVCDGARDLVGHIGVVGRVDVAMGKVWMYDQNHNAEPSELTLTARGGRFTVGSFGAYVLKGWLRVGGAPDLSCGVRTPAYAGASSRSQGRERLVTCPWGYWCDVDAGECRPNAQCGGGEACPRGTRCVADACVCDPNQPLSSTAFAFDAGANCFSAGPFVRNGEGCSLTLGVARDPAGQRALHLRDFDREDPQLLSPRLDWTVSPGDVIDVDLSCRGLSGPARAAARLSLSRATETPRFDDDALTASNVALTCDGTPQRLSFSFARATAGTRVGWLRLDPLDGEARFSDAQVWVRAISLRRASPGDPCAGRTCSGNGTCASGRCTCREGFDGENCDRCAVGYEGYPRCARSCAGAGAPCGSNPCEPARIDCSTGTPRCVSSAFAPAGTPCAGGVCNAGVCVSCAAGATCPVPMAECVSGRLDCTTGAPRCLPAGNVPDATRCAGGVCVGGRCVSCLEGSSCFDRGDPCRPGRTTCSTSGPVCGAVSLSDRVPCGSGRVCVTGTCSPTCATRPVLTAPSNGTVVAPGATGSLRWDGPVCAWQVKARWCCGSRNCCPAGQACETPGSTRASDDRCAEVFDASTTSGSYTFRMPTPPPGARCFRWVATPLGLDLAPDFGTVCASR